MTTRRSSVRDVRCTVVLALCLMGVVLAGCRGSEPVNDDPAVRIGAGQDAESQLFAEILVVAFRAHDIDATVLTLAGSRATRRALLDDRIDLRIVYTGESWLDVLGRADPPSDPQDSFTAVRDFDSNLPVAWLEPAFGVGVNEPPVNATFALVVDPVGEFGGIETISQLASALSQSPDAALCVDDEFRTRPDGLRSLLAVYSVRSNQPVIAVSAAEAVVAVAAGECVAGLTSATDGAAWLLGLKPLRDDLGVFPAFVLTVQLRNDLFATVPDVREILTPVTRELTTEQLGQFNARIVAGDGLRSTAEHAYRQLVPAEG